MSEDRVTPHSALAVGYIVGALHGVNDPYFRVVEILTQSGEIILEPVEGGTEIRVTVREISEPGHD